MSGQQFREWLVQSGLPDSSIEDRVIVLVAMQPAALWISNCLQARAFYDRMARLPQTATRARFAIKEKIDLGDVHASRTCDFVTAIEGDKFVVINMGTAPDAAARECAVWEAIKPMGSESKPHLVGPLRCATFERSQDFEENVDSKQGDTPLHQQATKEPKPEPQQEEAKTEREPKITNQIVLVMPLYPMSAEQWVAKVQPDTLCRWIQIRGALE